MVRLARGAGTKGRQTAAAAAAAAGSGGGKEPLPRRIGMTDSSAASQLVSVSTRKCSTAGGLPFPPSREPICPNLSTASGCLPAAQRQSDHTAQRFDTRNAPAGGPRREEAMSTWPCMRRGPAAWRCQLLLSHPTASHCYGGAAGPAGAPQQPANPLPRLLGTCSDASAICSGPEQ